MVVEHMGSLQGHVEALAVEGLAYTAVVGKQGHQVLDRRAGQGLDRRVDRVRGRDVGVILGKRLALVGPGEWDIRQVAYRSREGTSFQGELA